MSTSFFFSYPFFFLHKDVYKCCGGEEEEKKKRPTREGWGANNNKKKSGNSFLFFSCTTIKRVQIETIINTGQTLGYGFPSILMVGFGWGWVGERRQMNSLPFCLCVYFHFIDQTKSIYEAHPKIKKLK